MNRKTRLLRYWFLFYLWMACIFIGSSVSGEGMPDFKLDFVCLAAHFLEYFILGILCIRTIKVSYPQLGLKNLFISAIFFCLIFAFLDEFHQIFVPGRSWEVKDLVSDVGGSFLGILFYSTVRIR